MHKNAANNSKNRLGFVRVAFFIAKSLGIPHIVCQKYRCHNTGIQWKFITLFLIFIVDIAAGEKYNHHMKVERGGGKCLIFPLVD